MKTYSRKIGIDASGQSRVVLRDAHSSFVEGRERTEGAPLRHRARLDEQTKMGLTRGFDFWLEVDRRGSVHEVMLWKKGGSLGRYEDTIKEFRDRMQAWNYAVQEAQKLKVPAMLFNEGKLDQIYDPRAKEQFAFRQSAKRGLRKR